MRGKPSTKRCPYLNPCVSFHQIRRELKLPDSNYENLVKAIQGMTALRMNGPAGQSLQRLVCSGTARRAALPYARRNTWSFHAAQRGGSKTLERGSQATRSFSSSPRLTSERAGPTQIQSSGNTKDGRKLKPRAYPKFENLEDERLYRKQHLAAAFRVFADRGFDEGVAGHISVRDPILTDHFCECCRR